MRKFRRPLAPSILILALAATLLFAATAAAETKIAEGTSAEESNLPGEADLLKGSAEYDLATGTLTFSLTTRQTLGTMMPEGERPVIQFGGLLATVNFPCTREAFEAGQRKSEKEAEEGKEPAPIEAYPAFEVITQNRPFTEPLMAGVPLAQAYGLYFSHQPALGPPEAVFPGTKAVSGTTTTVSATAAPAANGPFNCAEIIVQNFSGALTEPDVIVAPLTTKPEPPPARTSTSQPPAPAPAANFSIGKPKRAVKLKVGKWRTVKVKVTNTGGSATTAGSLRLRAAKGVVVKSKRQKLPVLLPGSSWTVSYKIELTEKAKAKSTLSLTAAAGELTSTSSLVVKRKG